MIKLFAVAAMLSAQAVAPPPPPAAPRCLTRQQVGDLSIVGASIFVSGARTMCREHLTAEAFLASPAGERYANSLRGEAERRLDLAVTAFDRFGAPRDALGMAMAGTMIRGLMSGGPPPQLAGLADSATCNDLSLMIQAMAGMTPDQISQFSAAMASLGSRMEHRERERRYQARLARIGRARGGPRRRRDEVSLHRDRQRDLATVP